MVIRFTISILLVLAISFYSQEMSEPPDYLNPELPIEERVNDLVSRMTLEEKVSQMAYNAKAIPHLNVPEYNWWNECLHGVARAGTATVFTILVTLHQHCARVAVPVAGGLASLQLLLLLYLHLG